MTDGQRLFEIYRKAWGSTGGNVEPAPWDAIAEVYRPMWEAIAKEFADAHVRTMVNRFLGWPLPKTFGPDCGISFKPLPHPNGWPVGTNLFTADEARQMFEHALGVPVDRKPLPMAGLSAWLRATASTMPQGEDRQTILQWSQDVDTARGVPDGVKGLGE